MSLYTRVLRPLLFQFGAETVHHRTVQACRVAGFVPGVGRLTRAWLERDAPQLHSHVAGLRFANPIGLAAGWDKNGQALAMLDHLGLGFAEIGSVSARPSPGNPRPRLFRLPLDRAIVVNYGLPNDGADVVVRRLAKQPRRIPIGVNIVKTPDAISEHGARAGSACPEHEIIEDYVSSAAKLHGYADYLTLNLSCPNVSGGHEVFAGAGVLTRLLQALRPLAITCPVFLKVSPDPSPAVLEQWIEQAEPFAFVRGFMFNLPAGKPAGLQLRTPRRYWSKMPGAIAGKPVEGLINRCIAELYRRMPRERFVIVGGGGVFTAEDAYTKIRLGASLVQIYTALVYEGPAVTKRINQGLCELLRRDGLDSIQAAVGSACDDPHR